MTLALTGKTPRRRTALVLAAFFAIIGASLGGLWAVNTAFAHHDDYTASATCEGWQASATYTGGSDRRLLVIRDVKINGEDYAPGWSTDAGDSSPFGDGSIVPYTLTGADFWDNAPGNGTKYMWDDTDNGFSIFSRSGAIVAFNKAGNAWRGEFLLYERDTRMVAFLQWETKWTLVDSDSVTRPDAPNDCTGKLQVHKYLPKDTPGGENVPWQNVGNSDDRWTFKVYDNAALTEPAIATFSQLGSPGVNIPLADVWVTETSSSGFTFSGFYVPDGDGDSGNDKCNQQSADGPFVKPLHITPEMWATKGNHTGTLHLCAYNKGNPVVVKRTLNVEKVILGTDPDEWERFEGTIDPWTGPKWNTRHLIPVLVSDNLDPGTYNVHEDAKDGYTLKGFSVRYGEKAECPSTPESTGSAGVANLTDTNTIALVCVYNEKVPPADGFIDVYKVVPGTDVDSQTFSANIDGGTAFTFSEATHSGAQQVSVGTHSVTELAQDGYTTTGWSYGEASTTKPFCPATPENTGNVASVDVPSNWTKIVCFYNEKIPTYQVHIAKFIGAVHATEANAGNAEFPMTAVWKDIGGGIPDGSWPYTLSKTPNGGTVPFEAETRELLAGADYSTYETLGACSLAQPYELVGYTTSSTGFDTNPMHITTAVPSFTDIQGDQYVVVWNKPCLGSVIIHKVVEIGSSVNPDDRNPEFSGTFVGKPWNLHDGGQVVSVGVLAGDNHVITENPGTVGQPGDTSWRKPLFLAAVGGVCPTTSVGATTLDPDHITVVGGVTTTVCVLNHRNQPSDLTATVNVIKVVTGSVATTDTFDVALTTDAFKGGGGTASLAGGTGHLFSIGLDSDHHDAVFSVSETPRAGYTLLGYKLLVGGQGCPAPGGTYLGDVSNVPIGITSQQAYTVCVYNEPLVNITVHKTEQNGLFTQDGAGWKVTLSGCGMTPLSATTDAFGNAKFEKLPLCATYLVSEDLTSRAPLTYQVAAGYQATYTVSATTAGQTYSVLFANVLWSPPPYCEVYDCTPPKTQEPPETATPETPTETATAPVVVTTPTAPPAKTEIVEGEKTPGQQATPIAPETGSGNRGGSGMNIVLAGLGLAAVSLGLGTMALGKRRTR